MNCLAHLVRECTGMAEMGEEWAGKMVALFYDIMAVDQQGCSPSSTAIVVMKARFDRPLQEGLNDHNQLDPLPQQGRRRPRR